ncbi:acyl-CoA dehydrogenase family protein [Pseudoteredinibacter isoporae]|uniref:Alkylation response protein AidB-like acyl-CoA dehydrogenase n=1 Tax=Pseudoteredinibacter isoporae TaxID=570281 RepID=A0A7X0MVL4_9GAMM|nr:acyl-CoA dehydrogenase family protein [Pseudoteredinibacter isoporae]MBB6521235.1 alkylation response protein AidB-like acyl-CoA dehydrogenase [Pseudoteredinibacter isoporae]NHO86793.1 acyl-CoA dehydrogenase [Pseudoteredinibacter isoporae]NIB24755.1 acyl-CoA dehydrogenase [Pseudoteredinibacter isoporae]
MSHNVDDSELSLFREMAVRCLEQEVSPHYEAWEEAHATPKEIWQTLGAAGLLGPDLPEEYGAAEASFRVAQMITYEMSRMGFGGLGSGYNIHSNIVMPYILNIGTEEQKQQWLPKMVSGEVLGAIAMTEPGAGSDLAGMSTSAVRDGDDWILNGSKVFITNGIYADLVIVCAKTDPSAGAKGISLFLVDTSLPGFNRGKSIKKIGQHSNDTAELFFENMRVPANALLGEEGRGFIYLMEELPRERLGVASQAVGAADGAIALAVDYTKDRKAFGQSISQFQNTRFKMAECQTQVETVRALLEKNMDKYERGEMSVEDAAILKLSSTEMQLDVVDQCLQMFGGYGYTAEYPISRFYADARIQTIYAGTSEIMKEVISRSLFK